MYFVYILQSQKDHRFYIGCTSNIQHRLKRHNAGKVISTKHRVPFVLIYNEIFPTLGLARRREVTIKRMKGGIQFQQNPPPCGRGFLK